MKYCYREITDNAAQKIDIDLSLWILASSGSPLLISEKKIDPSTFGTEKSDLLWGQLFNFQTKDLATKRRFFQNFFCDSDRACFTLSTHIIHKKIVKKFQTYFICSRTSSNRICRDEQKLRIYATNRLYMFY